MITVQEVLAKGTWDENDIRVLYANVRTLPVSVLVKLGLAPANKPIEAVNEPVKPVEVAVSEEPVVLKKKGRLSKK
jgi:hypothetical protein